MQSRDLKSKKIDADVNSCMFSIPARVPEVKCGNSMQWNRNGDKMAVTLPYEEKATQVLLLTDTSQNFGKVVLNKRNFYVDLFLVGRSFVK